VWSKNVFFFPWLSLCGGGQRAAVEEGTRQKTQPEAGNSLFLFILFILLIHVEYRQSINCQTVLFVDLFSAIIACLLTDTYHPIHPSPSVINHFVEVGHGLGRSPYRFLSVQRRHD
jgi:hypothetical protein